MKPRVDNRISIHRLIELVLYNPHTGVFTWRRSGQGRFRKEGARVGTLRKDGYREAKIDGHAHLEHVLAWLYMTGVYPTEYLDHRNRKRDDNRFDNLRELPQRALNHANSESRRIGITKGIRAHSGGFEARITVNGKSRYLGFFHSEKDASNAYQDAARNAFGEYACFDIRGEK